MNKELSIEEKAKRYDGAIEELRGLLDGVHEEKCDIMEEDIVKIFPELKESEDERIRKFIKDVLDYYGRSIKCPTKDILLYEKSVAWLEKQSELKRFIDHIQIGDKVTRNKNGVLVNLSQLDRGAKQREKGANGNEREIPNFTWSEEDEKIYSRIYDLIHNAAYANYDVDEDGRELGEYAKITDWFKSLKNRVRPQSKQEWSKEDERKINRIYSILRQAADTHAFSTSCRLIGDKECIELQDFLHLLKDRYSWKPSDDQIEALVWHLGNTYQGSWQYKASIELLEQLDKLKE